MRRMHLNAMIFGLGSHAASWRMPNVDPLAITRLSYWTDIAQKAENGKFDALFLGDILSLPNEARYSVSGALDTQVVLSALAAVTKTIGLIGTASTTFDHPYHIARRFASIDHISNGRVGWNIVTSTTLSEAKNFGRDVLAPREERYARAEDVLNAVQALWASWQPDARIADKKSGLYLNQSAVHEANYTGSYTRSIGPLTVPHSPQGRPLLAQAGSSEVGKKFAAKYADVVFTAQCNLSQAQAFYREIKQRGVEAGRKSEDLLVFPGIVPILGKTHEEAQAKLDYLNRLALPESGIERLSFLLNRNLADFNLEELVPDEVLDIAESADVTSRVRIVLDDARRNQLTLKQMIERFLCSRGHLIVVGTAHEIADVMQEWFEGGAADGFNVLFPALPDDIEPFTRDVMPIFEKRGLRTAPQTGELLRNRFGLPMNDDAPQPVDRKAQIHAMISHTRH